MYRGRLGQPDTVRARTVSRPIRVGVRQCPTRVRRAAALYPTRVGRLTLFGPAPCRVALIGHSRNGSADQNVRARTHTGCSAATWLGREESLESAVLSVESAPFYRMARFLGIPRKSCAFCGKRRFLKSAEHIQCI